MAKYTLMKVFTLGRVEFEDLDYCPTKEEIDFGIDTRLVYVNILKEQNILGLKRVKKVKSYLIGNVQNIEEIKKSNPVKYFELRSNGFYNYVGKDGFYYNVEDFDEVIAPEDILNGKFTDGLEL